jgi:hypothetical protein
MRFNNIAYSHHTTCATRIPRCQNDFHRSIFPTRICNVLRNLHTLQMALELLGAKTVDTKGGPPYTKTVAEHGGETAHHDDDAEEGKRRRENLQKRTKGLGGGGGADGHDGSGVLGEDEALDKIFEQEGWDPVKRAFYRQPDWHRIHAQVFARTYEKLEQFPAVSLCLFYSCCHGYRKFVFFTF